MEIDMYVFGFSLVILVLGIAMLLLTSQEFKKMANNDFSGTEEKGPRAEFFDAMYELFSDKDEWPEKLRKANKSEIKKIVKEMNESRSKD